MATNKLQGELNRIKEDANMGFITPLDAINQTIDALHHAGEEIEDADQREAWNETVYASHRDNEHLRDAWEEICKQWVES